MKNPFRERPWLWVVAAFVVLIAAWTVLIRIAVRNAPESVPLETGAKAGEVVEEE